MFRRVETTFRFAGKVVTFQTGMVARQSAGSVLVSCQKARLLVTVNYSPEIKEGQDFFPLTIDYVEKFYANGRIPGGYIKREGKASDAEILISRLVDRPIRPMFAKDFFHELQVIIILLSDDEEVKSDILAILGASAAICSAGLPLLNPVGAVRVGYSPEEGFLLNPSKRELESLSLDLVVAGTKSAVLMVESEAKELSEDLMLEAIVFGHEQMQVAIEAIEDFVTRVNPDIFEYKKLEIDLPLEEKVRSLVQDELEIAFSIHDKQKRTEAVSAIWDEVRSQIVDPVNGNEQSVKRIFKQVQSEIVRSKLLNGEPRIDGRDTRTVRPIDIQLDLLPSTHGSVLFTRGETQSLAVTTLGGKQDEQKSEDIHGETSNRFMFHYNFPPFATGECGRVSSPKRREIGHGNLARRALVNVLPSEIEFRNSIRVVSEITESNGSSSMASVCGGCLSMLLAGVPLKKHVAGIAMGLILEGNRYAVLTDIIGDEDHLGDMDFKVAGTEDGITALQMDIKIQGINPQIMQAALDQARDGRMHILRLMKDAVPEAGEISPLAPRILAFRIPVDKIRDVIGKGGETVRSISRDTKSEINISEDGLVTVSSPSAASAEDAVKYIEQLTSQLEFGKIYEGTVSRILDKNIGVIVLISPNKSGFVHISHISRNRISNISDYLEEGQKVNVKVLGNDERGRARLSIKEAQSEF